MAAPKEWWLPSRRLKQRPPPPPTPIVAARHDPRDLLRWIVESGDLLEVDDRPWLLVPLSEEGRAALEAFEAEVEDAEVDDFGEEEDDLGADDFGEPSINDEPQDEPNQDVEPSLAASWEASVDRVQSCRPDLEWDDVGREPEDHTP